MNIYFMMDIIKEFAAIEVIPKPLTNAKIKHIQFPASRKMFGDKSAIAIKAILTAKKMVITMA